MEQSLKQRDQQAHTSAQLCGCDSGANHQCATHYKQGFVTERVNRPNVGIGGAPTRASVLPTGGAERKQFPVASGVMDYFPDALVVVANVSYRGNEQHNPGQPLHWDRDKSSDESDTMIRHFLQRGTFDTDGVRHSAKMVWRALAILQKELEQEGA